MKTRTGLAFLLLAGLGAGCSTDAGQLVKPGPSPARPAVQTQGQAEAWIGPGGGSLSVSGVSLVVPAKALAGATWVSLSVESEAGRLRIGLEPDGLLLNSAATLTVPCAGSCGLLWLNPSTGLWESLATTSTPLEVRARVIQFGRFEDDKFE